MALIADFGKIETIKNREFWLVATYFSAWSRKILHTTKESGGGIVRGSSEGLSLSEDLSKDGEFTKTFEVVPENGIFKALELSFTVYQMLSDSGWPTRSQLQELLESSFA